MNDMEYPCTSKLAQGKWNSNFPQACYEQDVYVVVQFYPWFKFYFLLFLGMVMCDNDFETKENII